MVGPCRSPPHAAQSTAFCTGAAFLWLDPLAWLFPVTPPPFEFEVVLPPEPALVGVSMCIQATTAERYYCRSASDATVVTILP